MEKIKSLMGKINQMNGYISASIYIVVSFSLILVGYGIGRYVIGMLAF